MPRLIALRDERVRERFESGTARRILERAISLFAERGFDQVTVREIADHAGANPAAISYYFGAKEQLIQAAIRSVIAPLNERRLAALGVVQATARNGRIKLEDVVRAMVEPTVQACLRGKGIDRHYARVLVLSFALRQPFVDEIMNEQTNDVAKRFVDALIQTSPRTDCTTMYWRYDFMIGAMLHILLDGSRNFRLSRLSEGLCDTSSPEKVTAQLVSFISAGMHAKSIGLPRPR